MQHVLSTLAIALVCAAALPATPAPAQPTRVFVAAQGSDGNACTFAAPCRTFQHAHDVVAAKGEIDVLDPAGYGVLNVSKAISIQGHGFAGISTAPGATAVTIGAGAADEINLNGLIIDGAGVGQNGIRFNTGKALTIENCVIRNMAFRGIDFEPTAASSLAVSNTFIAANGGSGAIVFPIGTGFTVRAVFSRVEAYNNFGAGITLGGTGIRGGTINGVIVDSVAHNNVGSGFGVQSFVGNATSALLLQRVTSTNNASGIAADGALATLRLAQSAVTANSVGFIQSDSAVLASYGDNYIDGNGGNTGSLTPLPRQ